MSEATKECEASIKGRPLILLHLILLGLTLPLLLLVASLPIAGGVVNETTGAHNPRVENIATSIRGVRLGMALLSPTARRTIEGISPYAAWEMKETDWAVYRRLWLSK